MRTIDHLVYSVPNLEQAITDLEQRLGIRPVIGGKHLTKGTKNALLNLGNGGYLEILAADASNKMVSPPRWMGVDLIEQPQLTRWCLKSNQLERDRRILRRYNPELGQLWNGERQLQWGDLLRWQMVLPLAHPVVAVLPFMCDWSTSAVHPTEQLADSCELLALRLYHPQARIIQPYFTDLGIEITIERAATARIEADIKGLNGFITI